MTLKKKVLGTLAAAALTLSMFGSAAADDSAHGTVTLAPGTCQASIDQATANFGTWTYNGATNAYVHNGNNSASFILAVHEANPNGTCPVSVEFSGLINGSSNIGPSHFQLSAPGFSGPLPSATHNIPGGNYAASLTLVSVPNNYQPGVYEGDVIVQVGVGA